MKELNPMCYNCLTLGKGCKGATCMAWTGCVYKKKDDKKNGFHYIPKNKNWNINTKIRAKFTKLQSVENFIYVGILPSSSKWDHRDYIDIMSYFNCVGFKEISGSEIKTNLPLGNYQVFLKLDKGLSA